MPLIYCKVHLQLNWIEDCTLSSAEDSVRFEITDAKLYVTIVTFSSIDSVNLTEQLSEGFKRSAYWNSYHKKLANVIEKGNKYELFNASFQAARILFILAYFLAASANTDEEADTKNNKKYFLPRREIKNYNVLIDGRNFFDQPNNDSVKQYD